MAEGRKCSHRPVPGYCADCGSKVFTTNDILYYEKFKDVFNLGMLKAIQQIEKIQNMDELNVLREKMYPDMRKLIDAYGVDIPYLIENLKEGKGKYNF